MKTRYELYENQKVRLDAWFKHHWEVIHKGRRPPDTSGFAMWLMFGPTGCGDNVKAVCVWCNEGHPGHEVDLTIDDDGDGEFIYEYDENWNRLPAPWEKKA